MTTDKMTKVSGDKSTKKGKFKVGKTMTSRRKVRKVTQAQEINAKKMNADRRSRNRELAGSKALKTIFHDANGKLQRAILNNGYLILSYSLQS
jgi:hypothetical protein